MRSRGLIHMALAVTVSCSSKRSNTCIRSWLRDWNSLVDSPSRICFCQRGLVPFEHMFDSDSGDSALVGTPAGMDELEPGLFLAAYLSQLEGKDRSG